MGCLKFIFRTISIILFLFAGFLFYVFGGFDWAQKEFNAKFNPSNAVVSEEAQKMADFSKLPKNYELKKAVNMLGVKAVIAEDKKNSQKMALVDTGWAVHISKDDIKSSNIEEQLKGVAQRFEKVAKIDSLMVSKKSSFKAMGQNVPYVKIKVGVAGNDKQSFEGIIGVATNHDGKDNLIISASEPGKFSQKDAETFFKSVNLKKGW